MDNKTLEKANQIITDIDRVKNLLEKMDNKNSSYTDINVKYLPDGLKEVLRPILKEYQEKLACQLKSL